MKMNCETKLHDE